MSRNSEKLEVDNQIVYFKSSERMDEIESESVQLVITSPPYWDAKEYGKKGIGYGQTYEEYIISMNKTWEECIRVLKPNGIDPTKEQLYKITMAVKDAHEDKMKGAMKTSKEEFVKNYQDYMKAMVLPLDEVLKIAKDIMGQ